MDEEKPTEEFIWNLLEQEYGEQFVAVGHELRHEHLCATIEVLAKAHTSFIDNPNTINWRIMITAMATYQYWKSKAVE